MMGQQEWVAIDCDICHGGIDGWDLIGNKYFLCNKCFMKLFGDSRFFVDKKTLETRLLYRLMNTKSVVGREILTYLIEKNGK